MNEYFFRKSFRIKISKLVIIHYFVENFKFKDRPKMKKHALLFVMMITSMLFTGCQGSIEEKEGDQLSTTGQDEVLMQMERDWSQVVVSQDISVLEKILSEDLVYHTEEGDVLNRQEYIDNFIKNKRNIQSVEVDNMKVFFFEGEIAVVTGTSKEIGLNEDSTRIEYSGLWTNFWLRENGAWQCIAGHGNTKSVK